MWEAGTTQVTRPGIERHSHAARTLLLVVAIRILVVGAGIAGLILAASGPPTALSWDEQSYLYLLEHGYPTIDDPGHRALIAFFPLYPMMAWPLAKFIAAPIALTLVSNLCSLVGFIFLYWWAREVAGERVAVLSLLVMATSASSMFFARALTEGPFLMFVAICLWLMQKGRFFAAAVICGLAAATRPTGVALAVTLSLYSLVHGASGSWRTRLVRAAAVGLIGVWGLVAYEAFLWHRYDQPTAYFTAQGSWEQADEARLAKQSTTSVRRYSLEFFIEKAFTPQALNRGFALMILAITVLGFFRPGPVPRVLFVLPMLIFLMTALPNHGLRISSVLRYESAAAPLFVWVGWWLWRLKRPGLTFGLLVISLALQLYYVILFARAVWVG